jgi:hypothetical protein
VAGKIPNFLGAEAAADRLAALPAWAAAHVVKANPDTAQRAVRARALTDGKVLCMAVPRLADELPFYLVRAGARGDRGGDLRGAWNRRQRGSVPGLGRTSTDAMDALSALAVLPWRCGCSTGLGRHGGRAAPVLGLGQRFQMPVAAAARA